MTTEPNPPSDTSDSITEKPADLPYITASSEAPPADAMAEPAPAVSIAASTPSRWSGFTDRLLFGLLLVLSFLLASFVATNSELWLQLASGRRINEGQHEFGVDPFSWATE